MIEREEHGRRFALRCPSRSRATARDEGPSGSETHEREQSPLRRRCANPGQPAEQEPGDEERVAGSALQTRRPHRERDEERALTPRAPSSTP